MTRSDVNIYSHKAGDLFVSEVFAILVVSETKNGGFNRIKLSRRDAVVYHEVVRQCGFSKLLFKKFEPD